MKTMKNRFDWYELMALNGAALLNTILRSGSFASTRPPAGCDGFAEVPGGRV